VQVACIIAVELVGAGILDPGWRKSGRLAAPTSRSQWCFCRIRSCNCHPAWSIWRGCQVLPSGRALWLAVGSHRARQQEGGHSLTGADVRRSRGLKL